LKTPLLAAAVAAGALLLVALALGWWSDLVAGAVVEQALEPLVAVLARLLR